MNEFSVTGAKVVVIGAARSGIAAARLLVDRGAHVVLTERRQEVDQSVTAIKFKYELIPFLEQLCVN